MTRRLANIMVGRSFTAYWPYLAASFEGLLPLFPEIMLFLPRRAGVIR